MLQVRDGRLQALLWQRALDPYAGAWALPGGALEPAEALEESIRRHLAEKVDVREVSHLEQLETWSDPGARPAAAGARDRLPRPRPGRRRSPRAGRHGWHPVDRLPALAFDHETILHSAVARLKAKLSYTNLGFALAPPVFTIAELRDLYSAALGHAVSATNVQRVLLRRGLLEDTGERRRYGRGGGRPAALYRFRSRTLEITDQFAVLRPPAR